MHVLWCLPKVAKGCWLRGRYFRDGYLRAMAELIEKELRKFDAPEDTEIFFSAHGVPVSYVEQVRQDCTFLPAWCSSCVGTLPLLGRLSLSHMCQVTGIFFKIPCCLE